MKHGFQPIHDEMAARFDALLSLSDGWYNGTGVAPDKVKLRTIASGMEEHYPESLSLPAIVPTQDGNLLFEWDLPGSPSIDLDLADMRGSYHAFLPGEAEIEREFQLTDPADWVELFRFLSEQLEQAPV